MDNTESPTQRRQAADPRTDPGAGRKGAMLPDRSFYTRFARLSSIIFALPGAMAAGYLIGRFVIDRFLPTDPWGAVGGTLAGAGAGFYETVKILMADQRSNDEPR